MLPDFWYDPRVLSVYGCAILRVDQRQIEARTLNNNTISKAMGVLKAVNLGRGINQATLTVLIVREFKADSITKEKTTAYAFRLLPWDSRFDISQLVPPQVIVISCYTEINQIFSLGVGEIVHVPRVLQGPASRGRHCHLSYLWGVNETSFNASVIHMNQPLASDSSYEQ